jgi:hypothetical protein
MVTANARLRTASPEVTEGDDVWLWTEALATARPGGRYTVARIPFSIARAHCRKLGCVEGDAYVCARNSGGVLVLESADGRRLIMARELAWFVHAVRSPAQPD